MTVILSRMIMMMILECSHAREFGGCFGHETISVLNGGFRQWLKQDLATESGEEKPPRCKSFSSCFHISL